MRISEQDRQAVSAAVAAAERGTSGEIVPVIAPASEDYKDIALIWSALAPLLALAVIAATPETFVALLDRVRGGWSVEHAPRELLTILLVVLVLKFAVARALLAWMPLRLALTPQAVKAGRARARALALFRVGAERRTVGSTGVLLYVSLAERRAEIVADGAINSKVTPETWGEAMAELVDAVRDGRPGDGMAAAIGRIGAVLAVHFPIQADDRNELPDRLIEL